MVMTRIRNPRVMGAAGIRTAWVTGAASPSHTRWGSCAAKGSRAPLGHRSGQRQPRPLGHRHGQGQPRPAELWARPGSAAVVLHARDGF